MPPNSYDAGILTGFDIVEVVPADADLTLGLCRALWIGTAGNLNIRTANGNDRDNVPAQVGLFPVRCIRVRPGASPTAAANIWAIY